MSITQSIRTTCAICLMALAASGQAQQPDFQIEKLPPTVNTPEYDEISPVISRDGRTLYFTRVGSPDFEHTLIVNGVDRGKDPFIEVILGEVYSALAKRPIRDAVSSEFNQDVWIAKSVQGLFDEVVHPGPPLNNALPNSICAITPDPDRFVIINQFPPEGGMEEGFSFIRRIDDAHWEEPRPFYIDDYYNLSDAVSLTMSSDGTVIIMSVERPDGHGNADLYVSFRISDEFWTAPVNLGGNINTPFRETTPSLSDDKRTLYFSSNRSGNNDIYFAERLDDSWTRWSQPERLPPPINSPYDDSNPSFNTATGYLYFTSRRDGSSDIFRARVREPKAAPEVVIAGQILNSHTRRPVPAKVLFGTGKSGAYDGFYYSNDGTFRLKTEVGRIFRLKPEKENFIGHELVLDFRDHPGTVPEYEVELLLDPIQTYARISMEPIYFVRSRAEIKPESFAALDKLATILKEYPELQIVIEGHTDNVGRPQDLQRLSEQRALAVKDYLVAQGIRPNRIATIGYGASKPVTDNSDEAARARNRRVEVRITRTGVRMDPLTQKGRE